jgi:hypothetical protein
VGVLWVLAVDVAIEAISALEISIFNLSKFL